MSVAFVGGIDLTSLRADRLDDESTHRDIHSGWHDAAVRLRGPAVADVGRHFVQRWSDVTADHLPAGGAATRR